MHYTDVLKDFYVKWEALEQMEKQEAPKLPTLSKMNTPLKWRESLNTTYMLHLVSGRSL